MTTIGQSETEWFEVRATEECGYPEPADRFEYLKTSYDLTEFCPYCGIGKRLTRGLSLSEYPLDGDYDFFSPVWVPDQLFATHHALSQLQECGISGLAAFTSPPTNDGRKHFQVRIDTVLPEGIVRDQPGVKVHRCPDPPTLRPKAGFLGGPCHRVKVGFTRPLSVRRHIFQDAFDFARLGDWVGSMGHAEQPIVCSKRVKRLYYEKGFRGLEFYGMNLVE
jgi:hypothetical protein